MAKRDVYIAIMRNSALGRSLTLSPDELDHLALDDAIATRAMNALTEAEHAMLSQEGDDAWRKIGPRKNREAANTIWKQMSD